MLICAWLIMQLLIYVWLAYVLHVGASKHTKGSKRETGKCVDEYPYELDVGIYWLSGNTIDDAAWVKSCPPNATRGFVYGKKTVVFVHGAQSHIVSMKYSRFGFDDEIKKLMLIWTQMGWNVGVFIWAQFADEPLQNFERAEAKIWTPRYFKNMEYTYYNNNTHTVEVGDGTIKESVAEIFVRNLLGHVNPNNDLVEYPDELRIVGHSLGTQVVLVGAYIMATEHNFMVARVGLLDPVFSPFAQGYLIHEACGSLLWEVMGCYVTELTNGGVAVEIYRSSRINLCIRSSEMYPALLGNAAFEHIKMNAWGEIRDGNCYNEKLWTDTKNFPKNVAALENQIFHQHVMIVPYYIQSLVYPPKRCTLSEEPAPQSGGRRTCTPTASLALSAAMPTTQVYYWHNVTDSNNHRLCFHQFDDYNRSPAGSTISLDPGDDLFFVSPCESIST